MRKNNVEQWLLETDKLDFTKFLYKNNFTKSEIVCRIHGSFYRTIKQIKSGNLCNSCDDRSVNSTLLFIERSKSIHFNKYNYSRTHYTNSRTKLTIECNSHGAYTLYPIQHFRGQGCKLCNTFELGQHFIKIAKIIHNDVYDYSKVVYINNKQPVDIICKSHGIFKQRPDNHLNLNGCPICKISTGEKIIFRLLKENNIKFEIQKKFKNCEFKYKLRFDFYIPEYNTCIEYNGIQHYQEVDFFGGKKTLEYNTIKDNIKQKYCIDNNIKLFIIKHDENIEEKISSFLKNNKIYVS